MASNSLVSCTKGNNSMVTYEGQSPSEIRTGDKVTDSLGRIFYALSDAYMELGDWEVKGETPTGDVKWFTLDPKSLVTISYDESAWNQDEWN